jgi:hypothetical protein
MKKGYIVSAIFLALVWIAAVFVPGGRGEALMAINALAAVSVGMLTYLTADKFTDRGY